MPASAVACGRERAAGAGGGRPRCPRSLTPRPGPGHLLGPPGPGPRRPRPGRPTPRPLGSPDGPRGGAPAARPPRPAGGAAPLALSGGRTGGSAQAPGHPPPGHAPPTRLPHPTDAPVAHQDGPGRGAGFGCPHRGPCGPPGDSPGTAVVHAQVPWPPGSATARWPAPAARPRRGRRRGTAVSISWRSGLGLPSAGQASRPLALGVSTKPTQYQEEPAYARDVAACPYRGGRGAAFAAAWAEGEALPREQAVAAARWRNRPPGPDRWMQQMTPWPFNPVVGAERWGAGGAGGGIIPRWPMKRRRRCGRSGRGCSCASAGGGMRCWRCSTPCSRRGPSRRCRT